MLISTSHHHADALNARSLAITQEPVELKRMHAQHALHLATAKKHAPTLIPPSAWIAKVLTRPRAGSVLGLWWRRLLCKYKQRATAPLSKHVSKQSRHLLQPMIPMPQQQVQIRPLWTSPLSSVIKVGPYNPKLSEKCDHLSPDPSLFVCLELNHRHYTGQPHSRGGGEMRPRRELK